MRAVWLCFLFLALCSQLSAFQKNKQDDRYEQDLSEETTSELSKDVKGSPLMDSALSGAVTLKPIDEELQTGKKSDISVLRKLKKRVQSAMRTLLRPTTEFVTDLRDDWGYLNRLEQHSKVIFLKEEKLDLRANGHLMVGGNVFGTTAQNNKVAMAILDLKKRRPDHVTILLSAEDIALLDGADLSTSKELVDYLAHGQLMAVAGDVLYVSGGLPEHALGFVPGETGPSTTLVDWVSQLNKWFQYKVSALVSTSDERLNAEEEGADGDVSLLQVSSERYRKARHNDLEEGQEEARAALIEYTRSEHSVLQSNWMVHGEFGLSPKVESYLKENHIRRLFVGHTALSDAPITIRTPLGIQVMLCALVNGDKSASVVSVTHSETQVVGSFNNGARHSFLIKRDLQEDIQSTVGLRTKDDQLVQTVLFAPEDENMIVLVSVSVDGRATQNKISEEDLRKSIH